MDNVKRKSLAMYLKVSRNLQDMSVKFESIGIRLWEGNLNSSKTVADDYVNANDELVNCIWDVMELSPNEVGNFEDLTNRYIYGETDDLEETIDQLKLYWAR